MAIYRIALFGLFVRKQHFAWPRDDGPAAAVLVCQQAC